MKIKLYRGKRYETIGTIYSKNDEVFLDFSDEKETEYFRNIQLNEKTYTPDDGFEYLKALIGKFSHSYSILLVKEERDKEWLKRMKGT